MPQLTNRMIQDYLKDLIPPREPELRVMERYAEKTGFPIVGPVAGNICYQVARLIGARSVFELGSGYGYSTAWFAKAVRENGGGVVHHVVWDEALSKKARHHLDRLGLGSLVQYHVAEAIETLDQSDGPFDLIFNDIDKDAYPASLPIIKRKLRRGGVLIVDNALWSGRIFDKQDRTAATRGIRAFTRLITRDRHWIVSVLPVRDGLLVAYKK